MQDNLGLLELTIEERHAVGRAGLHTLLAMVCKCADEVFTSLQEDIRCIDKLIGAAELGLLTDTTKEKLLVIFEDRVRQNWERLCELQDDVEHLIERGVV